MAFGGRHGGRAVRALWGAVAALCLFATPAFAQPGNGNAGRVSIEGVPDALQDDLKQLQREEPVPSSLFEARRQAERAAEVVATFLESQGYYQAEVEPRAEGVDTFTRVVVVTAGPLFTYASAKIDYLDSAPDDTTRTELESLLAPLDPGIPARAQPVIETGDALIARLRNAGYPDAKQDPVDALADAETSTVELTFKVRAGLRASFGKLSVSGLQDTNPKFIDNLRPWKANELVTPAKLDEFRSRLAQTGLFSTATARLGEADQAATDGQASREVVVEVKERERRTIALGASASTSDGVGVDGSWELRNYSGWGDSLKISGQVATLQRKLGATYTLPHIGKYGRILKVGTEAEDIETDAYDQTGANVSASIEEQITPRTRAAIGVEAGYASILEAADKAKGLGRKDVSVLTGSATAEYVGVRDILEPVNGLRARVAIEPGLTTGDTNILFGRFTGEGSLYYDFNTDGEFVGALRGKIGTIVGPNGYPPDKAFFAGGGGSVRGYEYQSLSPRVSTALTGGRSLVEMSAEVRYRATDTLGYVAFLDAGRAGDNVEPPLDSMSFGAGVGVRYYTAFGPLRADIAVPLNKKAGDADFQIYISIGQAF